MRHIVLQPQNPCLTWNPNASFEFRYTFSWLELVLYPLISVLPSEWSRGVCLQSRCLLPFIPFSVSDSTQRRRLCDRSRLQPRLWLYCQSHMWGEGGECGDEHTCTDVCTFSTSVSKTYYASHTDTMMNVSGDSIFFAYCISSHIINHHSLLPTVFSLFSPVAFNV